MILKEKPYLLHFVVLLFLALNFSSVSAQSDDKIIKKIDGKKCYIHHVEKGHTLYAISKKYAVEIEDIVAANPSLKEGLKLGQVLTIPVKSVNRKAAKDNPPEISGNYLVHTVEKGETLYALSKKYSVEIQDILEHNHSEVIDGLKLGEVIKIPATKVKHTDKSNLIPAGKDPLIQHKVAAKETLFSLSKTYGVSVDSIKTANNGLTDGLRTGQIINIPLKQTPAREGTEDSLFSEQVDTTSLLIEDTMRLSENVAVYKDTYTVAYFLPLYLDLNDTLEANLQEGEPDEIYYKTHYGLQFYEGVRIAIDSLKKRGMSVRVYIYDTQNDTAIVKDALLKKEMETMDLIIGPFFRSNFEIVADFARKRKIPVVSPVPQSNRILLGNPSVSKISPSPVVQVKALAKYIREHYPSQKILLVNSREQKDDWLVRVFKKYYQMHFDSATMIAPDTLLHELAFRITDKNISVIHEDSFKTNMDSTLKTNIVVVPSFQEVFISDLLTKLHYVNETYPVTIFGLDKWMSFEHLDIEYLQELNLHVSSPYYINFQEDKTRDFVSAFREKYFTDPDRFAFLGYDITRFYLSSLQHHGTQFYQKLPGSRFYGLCYSFDFFKPAIESGLENQYVHILKYQGYQLKKVN